MAFVLQEFGQVMVQKLEGWLFQGDNNICSRQAACLGCPNRLRGTRAGLAAHAGHSATDTVLPTCPRPPHTPDPAREEVARPCARLPRTAVCCAHVARAAAPAGSQLAASKGLPQGTSRHGL